MTAFTSHFLPQHSNRSRKNENRLEMLVTCNAIPVEPIPRAYRRHAAAGAAVASLPRNKSDRITKIAQCGLESREGPFPRCRAHRCPR